MPSVGTCAECLESDRHLARGLCTRCYAGWRRNRPGACGICGSLLESGESRHEACAARRRGYWARCRRRVMDHYGARCACCGETADEFLTIDHRHGGGAQDRAALGGGSNRLWHKIIQRGFPDQYRILCWSCNMGRERNGGVCPHESLATTGPKGDRSE